MITGNPSASEILRINRKVEMKSRSRCRSFIETTQSVNRLFSLIDADADKRRISSTGFAVTDELPRPENCFFDSLIGDHYGVLGK